MTRILSENNKCAVCGAVNRYRIMASTNEFGSPDLDLRPSEMRRSTMSFWVQKCPKCGYVSKRISKLTRVTEQWLCSEKYVKCNGISFESGLAEKFYQQYLISLEDQGTKDAFYALLHAAWSCDDEMDEENSKYCRELAIPLLEELIRKEGENKETLQLIKADLMRRSGHFDELLTEYTAARFSEDLLNQILDFQIQKAKEKDKACYRISDAARS